MLLIGPLNLVQHSLRQAGLCLPFIVSKHINWVWPEVVVVFLFIQLLLRALNVPLIFVPPQKTGVHFTAVTLALCLLIFTVFFTSCLHLMSLMK